MLTEEFGKTNSGRVAGIVVVVDDGERRRMLRVRVGDLGMAEIVCESYCNLDRILDSLFFARVAS